MGYSYGISRLSIIPVRGGDSDKSELVTQLLFGEHYTVLDISSNKKWIRIRIFFDGYEGWIDIRQHTSISKEYFNQINNTDFKISLDQTATLLYNKQPMSIVRGSILPVTSNELFKMEEQLAFNGETKSFGLRRTEEFIVASARDYLNAPYLWGGRTPFGIDCSGYVQMVFRLNGWHLARDASQQVKDGEKIGSVGEAKPCDLAFFNNPEGKITHVGMVLTDSMIIHASGRVRIDKLTTTGIEDVESNTISHHLHSIRRIVRI